jgi:membrane peptidoglycan carboxypeptidase
MPDNSDPIVPGEPQKPTPPENQPDPNAPTVPSAKAAKPLPSKLPPVSPRVNLDSNNMPLPRRVPERDPNLTRANPRASYDQPWDPEAGLTRRAQPPVTTALPPTPKRGRGRNFGRTLVNLSIVAFFLLSVVVAIGGLIGIYEYYSIARTLPAYDDINARASSFQSTYIYDSTGQQLYELNDPNKGRRTRIPLSQISPYLIAATIATEDADYYNHPGFDLPAIAKAIYRAYRYGGEPAGASTITQQLTRALYLRLADCDKPDADTACYDRSIDRKLREIILSAEIDRQYGKDEILELYLNEIYYGNLAYGIEAAAKTYFNKDAKDLTLGEATFLAGLPQAPATYDVFTNQEVTFNRQKQVLLNMVEKSGNCSQPDSGIEVRLADQRQRVCVTQAQAAQAVIDIQQNTVFTPPIIDTKYPHWVNYIRQILEAEFGQELYRSGYKVYTTLNPALQDLAEGEVKAQVDSLAASHVTDGALIAIDPQTGRLLAMVGSNSYDDPDDGQINMAIRPRQPGSSIKTLTYVAAFEKGWTPATLLWDVPTDFPDGANPPYQPRNYDGIFHGPVRVRDALSNSYNIPAVRTLQFVGIYDNPQTPEKEGLISFAERMGITTLTRDDYGLALTLGGGEVTLLELTNAYGILADSGKKIVPVAIDRIENNSGTVLCQQPTTPEAQPTVPPCQTTPADLGQNIVRPEHAFLISNILADNHARSLAFGPNSALHLSFPAAVKTGTTNDYRDNWTIGYTPNLVVGVWVGNADFTPMAQGVSGVTGAGPIWHNVMEKAWAALNTQPAPFVQPAGIVSTNICATTGAVQNDYCQDIVDPKRPNEPPVISEFFASDQPPLSADKDVVVKLYVDKFSGLRASPECNNDSSNTDLKEFVTVTDPFALKWLEQNETGQKWAAILKITLPIVPAPTDFCNPNGARPVVNISSPTEGQVLDGVVDITGVADVTGDQFDHYIVDWGIGSDPGGWATVSGEQRSPMKDSGVLTKWDTKDIPNGEATIRVMVFDKRGGTKDTRVHVIIQHPETATPVPTDTQPPATATATAVPTDTQVATQTATTAPPTATSVPPTDTQVATATNTDTTVPPSDTPVVVPTDTTTPGP